jgi:hypothetical protein
MARAIANRCPCPPDRFAPNSPNTVWYLSEAAPRQVGWAMPTLRLKSSIHRSLIKLSNSAIAYSP